MALGAISKPTTVNDITVSNKRWRTRDVVLTAGANYTTGGETVTAAAVGLKRIEAVLGSGTAKVANGATSRAIAIDYSVSPNVKVQAYNDGAAGAASTEVAASTDLSTFTARLTFFGV